MYSNSSLRGGYVDNSSIKISRGHPKLGATVDPSGTNFAVFSRNGKRVFIELYENFYDDIPFFSYELDRIYNKTGDIWHIYLFGIGNNLYYLWRVDGDYEPLSGHRFNKNKVLLDPYAKAISGVYDFDDPSMYSYDTSDNLNKDLSFSRTNSVRSACKNIVIDDTKFDWGQDIRPQIPVEDSIIYELHVRLFTMNTNSGVADRGTFDGIIEKIPHLLELGVTTLELMPIFEFNPSANVNINPLNGERLKDIWGYNPIGFFAVTGNYSHGLRLGEQVDQFKNFIKTIHKYGIEVILDVVYNHTGEGNELGPTISFRGLDNSIYYMLNSSNKRYYLNYSGTGNTLNCANPVVKELIIDSLRYWVTECHVDGFRFDLASILGRDSKGNWIGDLSLLKDIAEDPILYGTKLIAEGWDAAGGYYVGQFPYGWSEWNGKYRDTLRRFIRGDKGVVSDLATRICGSPDLFADNNRMPYSSVNFITAHDGFTLWDLVSYNRKHNNLNGEGNIDGMDENYSFNNGVEGETDDIQINKIRKRQIKNAFTILMISQGVPMILMGDEFCRTQLGNNNAYCQDNILSWVDWTRKEKYSDIFIFLKKVVEFRKKHKSLRRRHFFTGTDFLGNGIADVTWHGIKAYVPDWSYSSHTLALMISGDYYTSNETARDNDIYIALNQYDKPLEFEIPQFKERRWLRVIDTSFESPNDFLEEPLPVNKSYYVKEKSTVVLISVKR